MIKKIVFDLGNVLFPLEYEELHAWLETTHDGDHQVFRENFDRLYIDYEAGDFDTDAFFDILRKELKMKFEDDVFKQKWVSLWKRDHEDVNDLLHELKKHHKLYILSNTNEIHMDEYFQTKPILGLFDHYFLSYQMHLAKPNPLIYNEVQNALKVEASEIIFFDDKKDNIEAALSVGWNAYLFTDADQVKKDLSSHNLI